MDLLFRNPTSVLVPKLVSSLFQKSKGMRGMIGDVGDAPKLIWTHVEPSRDLDVELPSISPYLPHLLFFYCGDPTNFGIRTLVLRGSPDAADGNGHVTFTELPLIPSSSPHPLVP